MKALPTIAWVHHSTTHASTNYEPIRMLIGRKSKLPAECKEVGTDIREIKDLDPRQVEQIIDEVEDINFEILMGIRDGIFNDTNRNIKAAQK